MVPSPPSLLSICRRVNRKQNKIFILLIKPPRKDFFSLDSQLLLVLLAISQNVSSFEPFSLVLSPHKLELPNSTIHTAKNFLIPHKFNEKKTRSRRRRERQSGKSSQTSFFSHSFMLSGARKIRSLHKFCMWLVSLLVHCNMFLFERQQQKKVRRLKRDRFQAEQLRPFGYRTQTVTIIKLYSNPVGYIIGIVNE